MKLATHIQLIIAAALTTIMAACSHSDSFTVKGDIPALGAETVTLTLYTSAEIKCYVMSAQDGRFEIKGSAPEYALAELTQGRTLLADFVIRNGETVKVKPDADGSIALSGNKTVEQIADFRLKHADLIEAGRGAELNKAVAAYLRESGVTPAGAFVLMRYADLTVPSEELAVLFDPFLADDELATLVSAYSDQVRSGIPDPDRDAAGSINIKTYGDTLMAFNPHKQKVALFAFTNCGKGDVRTGHNRTLATLSKAHPAKKLRIIEFSLLPDSTAWRSACKADTTVTWPRAFLPGGVSNPSVRQLDVTRVPYYIVVDSTSHLRYRGADLAAATDTIKAIFKR